MRPDSVALVVTVLNEAASIHVLLDSVERQSRPPDEIVVVDGGSRDGTWEALQDWSTRLPMRLIQAPGATIAQGRNLAIESATCALIAVTDAGVRLEPDWLARLLERVAPGVDVVSGFFAADAHGLFERAMGATVLPAVSDVRPERFLPSSRSVLFRRAAWQAIGGYPEWLDYCEDLVFDLALKRAGCTFVFEPEAFVWFRPRGTLGALFRQYFRYARGDGKADLWRWRHTIRYLTYLILVALTLGMPRHPLRNACLLVVGGLAHTRRPYQRLWPALRGSNLPQVVAAVILVPAIRLVGDLAKMLGYPVGVVWRISRSLS